jgi:hypothetical protein
VVLVDASVASGAAGIVENPEAAQATFARLSLYAAHPRGYLQGMMQAIFRRPVPQEDQQRRLRIALQMPVSTGIAMLTRDLYGADLRPALKKFDRPPLVIAAASSPELASQQAMAAQIETPGSSASPRPAMGCSWINPGASIARCASSSPGWNPHAPGSRPSSPGTAAGCASIAASPVPPACRLRSFEPVGNPKGDPWTSVSGFPAW